MINYSDYITFVCKKPGYRQYINLINTFPVMENTNKYVDKLKIAIKWASYTEDEKVNIITKVPNFFKQGTVKIFHVEERGNSGRAWKISVNHKKNEYVLDLREDVLLEIIENYGISKGGIVNTDLMIVSDGGYKVVVATQEKIAEIKETMHKEQNLKRLPLKELKPLHAYRSKTEKILYLGRVYRISLADILNKKRTGTKVICTTDYNSRDTLNSRHTLYTHKSLTVYTELEEETIYTNFSEEETQNFIKELLNVSNASFRNIGSASPVEVLEETFYYSLEPEITKEEACKQLRLLLEAAKKNIPIYCSYNPKNKLRNKIEEIADLIKEYSNDVNN